MSSQDRRIAIELRRVYGTVHAYPVDDAARALARVAGTKTLSIETLKGARALGYVVDCHALPSDAWLVSNLEKTLGGFNNG